MIGMILEIRINVALFGLVLNLEVYVSWTGRKVLHVPFRCPRDP
jgi:hypothetical protein